MTSQHNSGRMTQVAALYVQTGGSYFRLPDVDPWDEGRDARAYAGHTLLLRTRPVSAGARCGRASPETSSAARLSSLAMMAGALPLHWTLCVDMVAFLSIPNTVKHGRISALTSRRAKADGLRQSCREQPDTDGLAASNRGNMDTMRRSRRGYMR